VSGGLEGAMVGRPQTGSADGLGPFPHDGVARHMWGSVWVTSVGVERRLHQERWNSRSGLWS